MAKEMRQAYANALIEEARVNDKIVVLEADLMSATGTKTFKSEFPERTIDVGVAEANMVGMAAGLSVAGYIPFAATFGTFAARRALDQFFISGAYAKANVKLVGTDPGVTAAFNGGTHMPFEDTGIMKLIPNLTIVEPSDPVSAAAFTHLLAKQYGCAYMRLHRKGMDDIYSENETFEIGKSKIVRNGNDVCIFALGAVLVHEAIKAADELKKEGINVRVVDVLTLKPIDKEMILKCAKECAYIITLENNQVSGGLYSSVLEIFNENHITKYVTAMGIHDEFGQVGTLDYLLKNYALDKDSIMEVIRNF